MAEYQERRTVVDTSPIGGRAIIEQEYDTTVHEPRGMSSGAVATVVIALIAAAVLITYMIVSGNQQSRETELLRQRDQAEASARAAQATNQQPAPPVVVMPQPQPAAVPVLVPVPSPSPSASPASEPAVSDTSIEVEINSKLLNDEELRPHSIEVKFSAGTATLSGEVPSDDLKTRAGKVAKTIKGVRRVVNNITVSE